MKVHITRLYGMIEQNVAYISQKKFAEIGNRLGFREISLFRYPVEVDSPRELSTRLDGILAGVEDGDIVIFQSPSWNDLSYDRRLLERIRTHKDVKIIIFVEDVVPIMFHAGTKRLREQTAIYNMADLIILPSEKMRDTLKGAGLTVSEIMIQPMCDYPFEGRLCEPEFRRELHFTGKPSRFPFVESWNYPTTLHLYAAEAPRYGEVPGVVYEGWKNETELLLAMSKGGFGLVWPDENDIHYYERCQPYKFGNFLTAGIPVVLKRGMAAEQLVRDNHLGFVVDSLEEANRRIQNISAEEFADMQKHVREFQILSSNGMITKRLFTEAINRLYIKKTKQSSALLPEKIPTGAVDAAAADAEKNARREELSFQAEMQKMEPAAVSQREFWEDDEDTVQICFGLHDKNGTYSYHIGVVMLSILDHTDAKCHFHVILDDTVSVDNRIKMRRTAEKAGGKISFHPVNLDEWNMTTRDFRFFTIGANMRLMAPELLLNLKRVIYMDADLIVCADVADLWNVNIDNYALAAVPDMGDWRIPILMDGTVPRGRYCNSGVMVMNLDWIRRDGRLIERGLHVIRSRDDILYPDQDAMSILYWKDTYLLDLKWNTFAHSLYVSDQLEEIVYHYAGDLLNLLHPNVVDTYHAELIKRTEWKVDIVENEYKRIVNVAIDRVEQLQKLAARLASGVGKRKIFYGKRVGATVKVLEFLPINPGDGYICDGDGNSWVFGDLEEHPITYLEELERGTFTLFASPVDHYVEDRNYFNRLGLVEGVDFFNTMRLVDRNNGGYA